MRNFVSVLVAVVAISIGYGLWFGQSRSEWEIRVESALVDARAWEAQAEVYRELANSAEVRAEAVNVKATERVRVVRERVVEVREVEAPAIAQPFVAVRDSIIDELLVVVKEKDEAIAEYVSVVAFLRQESKAFELRGDSLEVVLEDRPGPRKWWMPKLGLGPFTGVCQGGGFCSGVGVTLSWSIQP